MVESGVAILGSAQAEGEDRALNAIGEALNSPLLNTFLQHLYLAHTSSCNELNINYSQHCLRQLLLLSLACIF